MILKVVTWAERPNYKLPKPSNINIVIFTIIWNRNMVLSCFLIGTERFLIWLCSICFFVVRSRFVSYFFLTEYDLFLNFLAMWHVFLINHTACSQQDHPNWNSPTRPCARVHSPQLWRCPLQSSNGPGARSYNLQGRCCEHTRVTQYCWQPSNRNTIWPLRNVMNVHTSL